MTFKSEYILIFTIFFCKLITLDYYLLVEDMLSYTYLQIYRHPEFLFFFFFFTFPDSLQLQRPRKIFLPNTNNRKVHVEVDMLVEIL